MHENLPLNYESYFSKTFLVNLTINKFYACARVTFVLHSTLRFEASIKPPKYLKLSLVYTTTVL